MARNALGGVALKLSRAHHHFKSLEKEVGEMYERFDNAAEFYPDTNSKGKPVLRVRNLPVPDPRIGVLIGDVAHNLRSALDHLAYLLCTPEGRSAPERPGDPMFPITSSSSRWRSSAWRLAEARRGAKTRIEQFQPYHKRSNPPTWLLWQLRELSDIDKHRLIHVAPAAIQSHQVGFSADGPGPFVFRPYRMETGCLREGGIAIEFDFDMSPELQVELETNFVMGIAFDRATPSKVLRDQSVLPMLEAAGQFIDRHVVPSLAPLLDADWHFEAPEG